MSIHVRRWWPVFLTLAVLVSAGLFAACGDDDDGGSDGEPPAGDDGGRIEGGELTVQSFEFSSLDPHVSSTYQDLSLHRMVWRGLYTLDKDNVPQPAMAAEKPEISEDGRTYTIRLREGLKWSDGDDLTAEDFVAGIYRTCNPENAGEYEYILVNLEGCDAHFANEAGYDAALEEAIGARAVDPTTIEFELIEPQPTFTTILSLYMTFPSPVHLLPNSSDPWPSGTEAPGELAYNGPYILTDYVAQDSITLEPNPEWAAPAGVSPTLDRITIKFIDDLSQATNAYSTDEIQATGVDVTQLESIIDRFGEGEEYFKTISPTTIALGLQMEKPPLDNLDVRLALSQAIDRVELNRVVFGGGNEPTTSWIPEVTGGHSPNEFVDQTGFDPAKAKESLARAGFADGEGFPELTILGIDLPESQDTAEFLQQAFKTHLNIDVQIEIVDSPTQFDRYTAEQFDLIDAGWLQDYPDPENWVLGQFETGGSSNHYNCSDPEIDSRVEEARFNADEEERLQLYSEINEMISTRLCGVIPHRHSNNHWLIKPNVVGMRENLSGQDFTIAGDWAAEYWGLAE